MRARQSLVLCSSEYQHQKAASPGCRLLQRDHEQQQQRKGGKERAERRYNCLMLLGCSRSVGKQDDLVERAALCETTAAAAVTGCRRLKLQLLGALMMRSATETHLAAENKKWLACWAFLALLALLMLLLLVLLLIVRWEERFLLLPFLVMLQLLLLVMRMVLQ